MSNCKRLLILSRAQFGYDLYYYYCKWGGDRLEITYVGFDVGRPRIVLPGIDVTYVSCKGVKPIRFLKLALAFLREAQRGHDVVLIKYFLGCSLFRLLSLHHRAVLDVRTGCVGRSPFKRMWENLLMRAECRLFPHILTISPGLVERFSLPQRKTQVVPLGAEQLAMKAKRFDELHLLYVGTLDGRRIEDTVLGFGRFAQEYGDSVKLSYTIVGDGHNEELEGLRRMVRLKGLQDTVHLPGYVHKTQLQDTFEHCNVGISYVPMSDIYDCQPVTKTFEYVFAGMPVIATATTENSKVVNRLNGVLIQDTPEGVYRGLEEVYARRDEFDSEKIRLSCPESSWDRIVGRNLVPYVQNICQS